MRLLFFTSLFFLFFFIVDDAFSQKIIFNKVLENTKASGEYYGIKNITQDKEGYIWLSTNNNGILRFDGIESKYFKNDPSNINSLADNNISFVSVDSNNNIWIDIGYTGVDKYDPSSNSFTHFRHNPKNPSSISSDTVNCILTDHSGNIWIGTNSGLDLFNQKTSTFSHYTHKENDISTIGNNMVWAIYEDRQHVLWLATTSSNNDPLEKDALNMFNLVTGKCVRYVYDSANPNSIAKGIIISMFEDSRKNFWIGVGNKALDIMNKKTGLFTHHYYDSTHPGNLSRPSFGPNHEYDYTTFIKEDLSGYIWIGTTLSGINRYNPLTKEITHYGGKRDSKGLGQKDTTAGAYNDYTVADGFISKDGLLWVSSFEGKLYNADVSETTVPFYSLDKLDGNTFYYDTKTHVLWVGTSYGLLSKNLDNGNQKMWKHDPLHAKILSSDTIGAIRVDKEGKFWMATAGGISKYDPLTGKFISFQHDEKNPNSLSNNNIDNICLDREGNVWIVSWGNGMDRMDKAGNFKHYTHNDNDTNSLINDHMYCVIEELGNGIWAGTRGGLDLLKKSDGRFYHYLKNSSVASIFIDHEGTLWAGANDGLYQLNRATNKFLPFADPNSGNGIKDVLHIMEDNQNNLWVSTTISFIKINKARDDIKIYGEKYGVHKSEFAFADNFKAANGELFFGDQTGYYAFFPEQLSDSKSPPILNLVNFYLGDEEIKAGKTDILTDPLWKATEIKLNYKENIFSVDFKAISYTGNNFTYLFKLENYDNSWHQIGLDHKAYFFDIPPGTYIFHAKAVDADGNWGEKSITIIISPPWWHTWWAISIFILLGIVLIWAIINYQSKKLRRKNILLEEKVAQRTQQLKRSFEELKSTQAQLVQSEKMASLGELTAGIAHEIQNPLNFVNNFSEISNELIAEMNEELNKGDISEAKIIAEDIKQNLEKINHHGKRAGDIVKNMLQHSRSGSGAKEPANINALADEYFRLAYHGLRAKDKSFNATMKTDFDSNAGTINIVSQDIARVILNLINNAFYAVAEKKKQQPEGYQPTVSVSTKREGDKIYITIKDNGNGIPQKVLEKIFQPFFTTKPTGQGTGLGLSLSYDIVKAHGGEIKIDTEEGSHTTFTVMLPSI